MKDGILQIPLYHGTSSIFLDSIRKFGLGAKRNPEIFSCDLLQQLASAVSEKHSDWWELNSGIVERMLKQQVTGGNYNFRYGGTYLTPSRSAAIRYATTNLLGSEFLSIIYGALDALERLDRDRALVLVPADHGLRDLIRLPRKPLLITVTNLETRLLRTEQGEAIDSQLKEMETYFRMNDSEIAEVMLQVMNFELPQAISSDHFKIELLDHLSE
jgi:hypothetical protein